MPLIFWTARFFATGWVNMWLLCWKSAKSTLFSHLTFWNVIFVYSGRVNLRNYFLKIGRGKTFFLTGRRKRFFFFSWLFAISFRKSATIKQLNNYFTENWQTSLFFLHRLLKIGIFLMFLFFWGVYVNMQLFCLKLVKFSSICDWLA